MKTYLGGIVVELPDHPISKIHEDHTFTCMCGEHVGFGDLPKRKRTQKYINVKIREHESQCVMVQEGRAKIFSKKWR